MIWPLIKEEFQNDVVRYLTDSMDLLVPNTNQRGITITPIAVFATGMGPKNSNALTLDSVPLR